jgi:hypothetical protein
MKEPHDKEPEKGASLKPEKGASLIKGGIGGQIAVRRYGENSSALFSGPGDTSAIQ